jgi:hypothetical protein
MLSAIVSKTKTEKKKSRSHNKTIKRKVFILYPLTLMIALAKLFPALRYKVLIYT